MQNDPHLSNLLPGGRYQNQEEQRAHCGIQLIPEFK